jgi:outer membrane protein assembly factor BamA
MPSTTLTLMLMAVAVLSAGPVFAQPPVEKFSGRPISTVQVLVERAQAPEPALAELVETRVGQPLSMADVRETITHLFSLGRFQDIQVEVSDAADGGVEVRYNVIPIHAVEELEFDGTLGLSEGLLRD